MNKSTIITWVLLVILTIASALFSKLDAKFVVVILMLFAVLKFIGVAFQFMELKKAHSFWKIAILSFVFIFTVLVLSII